MSGNSELPWYKVTRFYSVWIRIWMRKTRVCMCVSMNMHYTHVGTRFDTLVNIHL